MPNRDTEDPEPASPSLPDISKAWYEPWIFWAIIVGGTIFASWLMVR